MEQKKKKLGTYGQRGVLGTHGTIAGLRDFLHRDARTKKLRVVQTKAVATKPINRHKAKYQGPFVFGRRIRGAKRPLASTKIFLAEKKRGSPPKKETNKKKNKKKKQAIVVTGRSGLRPGALLAN